VDAQYWFDDAHQHLLLLKGQELHICSFLAPMLTLSSGEKVEYQGRTARLGSKPFLSDSRHLTHMLLRTFIRSGVL